MDETLEVNIPINITSFQASSDGDPDINTQDGRKTQVQASWHLQKTGREFKFFFLAEIYEVHPDNTELFATYNDLPLTFTFGEMIEVVAYPNEKAPRHSGPPYDWSASQGFGRLVYGKQRAMIDWTNSQSVRKAGFTHFYIHVDGPGRDDRGNARLKATLQFKFTLRHKEIESKGGAIKKLPLDRIVKVTPSAKWIGKDVPSTKGVKKNNTVTIVRTETQPLPRRKVVPKAAKKIAKRKVAPKARPKVSPKPVKRPVVKKARRK
jgi:hypothetical protein